MPAIPFAITDRSRFLIRVFNAQGYPTGELEERGTREEIVEGVKRGMRPGYRVVVFDLDKAEQVLDWQPE